MYIIKDHYKPNKYTENKPMKKVYKVLFNDGYVSPATDYETACAKAFEFNSNTLIEMIVIDWSKM